MRLGVFGGSFDPVHVGHLVVAETCREEARLDRVLFVPAAVAPHKEAGPFAAAADRVAMLELAIGGNDRFALSTLEIDRGGVSYTVDTLAALRDAHPDASLHLMLGPDSLERFGTWRDPARILRLASLLPVVQDGRDDVAAICDRGGLDRWMDPGAIAKLAMERVVVPVVGVRSTAIRQRVAAGRGIGYRVPRAVERYIEGHGIYRGGARS